MFLNHVRISLGSQAELLTLREAARRLRYLDELGTGYQLPPTNYRLPTPATAYRLHSRHSGA